MYSSHRTNINPVPVVVGGPSGVGKTTLVSRLIQENPKVYSRPESLTTRARRYGEQYDEYSFADRETVMSMAGDGLLANLDNVYGNLYAITKDSLRRLLASGFFPLKEVHPRNHPNIKKSFPNAISILLLNSPDAILPNLSDPGRTDDDQVYYRNEDTAFEADVVLFRSHSGELELARHAHRCIQAQAKFSNFPKPGYIDRVNSEGYSQVAAEYSEDKRLTTANFHSLSQEFFASALRQAEKINARCLEVGAGKGWLRKTFNWGSRLEYTSVDLVPAMSRHDPAQVIASARMMPFDGNSFDAIFSSLADPFCYAAALCELRRVLRPHGSFYLTVPSACWSQGLRLSGEMNQTRFKLESGDSPTVFSFTFTLRELELLLEVCGFEVENSFEATIGERKLDPLSNALVESAHRLDIPIGELPILNCVHARARHDAA